MHGRFTHFRRVIMRPEVVLIFRTLAMDFNLVSAGTTSSTTDYTLCSSNFRIWLTSHDDQFYTLNSSIGQPKQSSELTVDTRPDGIILADASWSGFSGRHKYSRQASGKTYREVPNPTSDSANVAGTDLVWVSPLEGFWY